MKFNIKWALAVVVVVLVGLAAAPWTVSQNAQIAAIETQIKAGSGLRLVSHGRSVFAVLPRPHIRIYDASLEQGGGALTLLTSSLRVDLGLAGLATGQLSLARIVLADAVFTLDTARAPSIAAASGAKPPRGAPGSQQGGTGKALDQDLGQGLGEVQVTNGKITLRRAGAEKPEIAADEIDAQLEWSGAGAPLSLVGHCVLPSMDEDRGPARFALWAAQPDKWTRGDASAITLHIDDGAFVLNLNGALALTPFPHFLGQIDGAAPSLRVASQWLGLPLPLPGPYRDATLKGEASLDPDLLSFTSLSISVDGNALDGAASIRLDGQRPQIAATLAGASVNLAPLIEDWPALSSGGQWSHDAFSSSHLAAADLDLRLSANHVRLGDFQADSAALSAILKNGRLDLSLAEASAYSGQIRARAVIAESAAGFDLRGSISAEKIDVAALLWDGFKRQALTGVGRGGLSFETSGNSFYELASHLDGRGDLAVDNGEIYGLDLGLAFRRMERRPLTAGVELRSGRTGFTDLATKFSIVQGVAEIEEGVVRDDRMTTYFSGRAQIAERTLDLHAAASRSATSGGDATPLQLGFSISGAWDDATVVPDALSLINRSDAAAPLLPKKACRNRMGHSLRRWILRYARNDDDQGVEKCLSGSSNIWRLWPGKSISAAPLKSCNVSQPTLSAAISQMEEELGVLLIERDARFQGLTPEGEIVIARARRILVEIELMRAEVAEARDGLRGKLRFGVIPTALPMAVHVTAPFCAAFPSVTLEVLSLTSDQILERLENFELDAGMTYLDNEPLPNVLSKPIYAEVLLPADPPRRATRTA